MEGLHHTPPSSTDWPCTICKIMVAANSKAHHEASRRHRNMAKSQPWTCTLCNLTYTAAAQESHEAGKKHRAKAIAAASKETSETIHTTSPPLAAPSGPPSVVPPGKNTKTTNLPKRSPGRPIRQTRPPVDPEQRNLIKLCQSLKPQWWTCGACNITMYANTREAHEGGKCTGKSAAVVKIKPGGGNTLRGKKVPGFVGGGLQKRLEVGAKEKDKRKGQAVAKKREGKEEGRRGEEE